MTPATKISAVLFNAFPAKWNLPSGMDKKKEKSKFASIKIKNACALFEIKQLKLNSKLETSKQKTHLVTMKTSIQKLRNQSKQNLLKFFNDCVQASYFCCFFKSKKLYLLSNPVI